jgi:hypothetical protein
MLIVFRAERCRQCRIISPERTVKHVRCENAAVIHRRGADCTTTPSHALLARQPRGYGGGVENTSSGQKQQTTNFSSSTQHWQTIYEKPEQQMYGMVVEPSTKRCASVLQATYNSGLQHISAINHLPCTQPTVVTPPHTTCRAQNDPATSSNSMHAQRGSLQNMGRTRGSSVGAEY